MGRKTKGLGISLAQQEKWRSRIQTGMVIRRLHEVVRGEVEMTTARLKACEILLRKTLPDLSSVEISGGSVPVAFTWGPAIPEGTEPVTIEATAKQLEPRYKGKVPEGMVIEADKALEPEEQPNGTAEDLLRSRAYCEEVHKAQHTVESSSDKGLKGFEGKGLEGDSHPHSAPEKTDGITS